MRPWPEPWSVEHAQGRVTRPLRHNGVPYRGVNVVMPGSAAATQGFANPFWLPLRQAPALGGRAHGGGTGRPVVCADRVARTEENDQGEETERRISFLKSYTVFNAAQCTGLPAHYHAKAEPLALSPTRRIEAADRFFARTGAAIRHGGDRAFHAGGPDRARTPPFETFRDAGGHAAARAREPARWTKHEQRSGRDSGRRRFGGEGHAKEERAAEPGAAFVCAGPGVAPEVREDRAAPTPPPGPRSRGTASGSS